MWQGSEHIPEYLVFIFTFEYRSNKYNEINKITSNYINFGIFGGEGVVTCVMALSELPTFSVTGPHTVVKI